MQQADGDEQGRAGAWGSLHGPASTHADHAVRSGLAKRVRVQRGQSSSAFDTVGTTAVTASDSNATMKMKPDEGLSGGRPGSQSPVVIGPERRAR